jgi:hypothetical protein
MTKPLLRLFVVLGALVFNGVLNGAAYAASSAPKVVAFYAVDVEPDHARFAQDALQFFAAHARQDGYDLVSTTNWDDSNDAYLVLVEFLNSFSEYERHLRQAAARAVLPSAHEFCLAYDSASLWNLLCRKAGILRAPCVTATISMAREVAR